MVNNVVHLSYGGEVFGGVEDDAGRVVRRSTADAVSHYHH